MTAGKPIKSIILLASGAVLGACAVVVLKPSAVETALEQNYNHINVYSAQSNELAMPANTRSVQPQANGQNRHVIDKSAANRLSASPVVQHNSASPPEAFDYWLATATSEKLERIANDLSDKRNLSEKEFDRQVTALFEHWSEIDFDAALQYLEYRQWDAMVTGKTDALANQALAILSRLKPDEMLQWAEAGLTLNDLSEQSTIVYQQLAESDPERALHALVNYREGPQSTESRQNAIDIIVQQWSKKNPALAWEWLLNNNTDGVLNQYQRRTLSYWAANEPNAALVALNDLPASLHKTNLHKDYAVALVKQDPQQAFDWAVQISDETLREYTIDTVAYHWASTQPNAVIAHLDSITDPLIRKQLLYGAGPTIASAMITEDPLKTIHWSDNLALDEQAFIKPLAFQSWFQEDAQSAASWLSEQGDPSVNTLYLSNVASSLPYSNLPVAMELFPSLSPELQENMAGPIALGLYETDSDGVQNWVDALPSLALRNKANSGLLYASIKTEPVRALELANTYSGDDKLMVLTTAATEVDQQHPGLLEQWLDSANITDQERHSIAEALIRQPNPY